MRNSPFKEGSANNSQTFLKMDVHVVHLQLFCYPLYLVFTLLWSRSFCPGVNQQTAGSLFWRTAAFFLWNVFNYNTRTNGVSLQTVIYRTWGDHCTAPVEIRGIFPDKSHQPLWSFEKVSLHHLLFNIMNSSTCAAIFYISGHLFSSLDYRNLLEVLEIIS